MPFDSPRNNGQPFLAFCADHSLLIFFFYFVLSLSQLRFYSQANLSTVKFQVFATASAMRRVVKFSGISEATSSFTSSELILFLASIPSIFESRSRLKLLPSFHLRLSKTSPLFFKTRKILLSLILISKICILFFLDSRLSFKDGQSAGMTRENVGIITKKINQPYSNQNSMDHLFFPEKFDYAPRRILFYTFPSNNQEFHSMRHIAPRYTFLFLYQLNPQRKIIHSCPTVRNLRLPGVISHIFIFH